jgi:hypothetical protein
MFWPSSGATCGPAATSTSLGVGGSPKGGQPSASRPWPPSGLNGPRRSQPAEPVGVSVISGGGFDSLTAKHDLAQEIAKSNRPVRLLHVGDYDPSGVHLFSALDEDVRGFLTRLNPDARVVSERVAILPEQFERFQLQPAPAKATDNSSFVGIGDDPTAAVQAEALAPDDLADLV